MVRAGGMDHSKKEVLREIHKGKDKDMGKHKTISKLMSSPTLVMHQFREASLYYGNKLTPESQELKKTPTHQKFISCSQHIIHQR